MNNSLKPETLCVQGGWQPKNGEPRVVPIYQSTTFKYDTSEQMARLFDLEESGYFYTRLQNPTNDAVAAKIAALEGGVGAMLTSSGQAANFYAVFNICEAGDHLVCSSTIYGGTFKVSGQAGFSVCEHADLLFDPTSSAILVSGNACGIAVENRNAPTSIVINGGTFESTGRNGSSYDGVWFSNRQATMTITGGTFIGSVRSGLYFQLSPVWRNVQISGGTFNRSGNNSPIDGSYSEYFVIATGYRLDKSNPSSWQVVAN